MPEQSSDYRVAVFGSAGVGKSSLVQRFIRGTFSEAYSPTVEDTYRQVMSSDKQVCTLQITDSSGSHQFPAMTRLSISKGHAFVLVYSVTARVSLVELNAIVSEIKELRGAELVRVPVMLVGNKCDEFAAREVSRETAATLAAKWGFGFIETSAKDNVNVWQLFSQLLGMDRERDLSLLLCGGEGRQKSPVSDEVQHRGGFRRSGGSRRCSFM